MHKEARGKGQGARGKKNIETLIDTCANSKTNIIIVSNEVGMGIVPDNPLARQFRDIAGFANQKMAEAADEVYLMVSGIPLKIK
jgi:adenosylcobinamide kinase/adenosylcobinamide-phosphate guanylyltransferase